MTIALSASMHKEGGDLDKFEPCNRVVSVPIILRLKLDLVAAISESAKATACLRDSNFVSYLYNRNNHKMNYAPMDTFNNKTAIAKIKKFDEDNIAFTFSNMAASQ